MSYNVMNIIKEVKFQPYQAHSNRYNNQKHQNLSYPQDYPVNPTSKKAEFKIRTQMTEQREQRQTLQTKAKTHLFEQSQVHSHKVVTKSYELTKNVSKKANKSMMLQTQQQITAFEYDNQPAKNLNSNLYHNKFTKSNESNPANKRELRFQIPNHQIYWNKKQHAQVMILRPTILNPDMLSHKEKVESPIKDCEPSNKKDFEKIINKILQSSKDSDSSSSYNMQRFKKRAKIRSIEKKIVKLRSKSTNFIEEYQRTQLLNQFEKITQNCAFHLQIKCLKSQKQLIEANKTKTVNSNKDLKQKIKHLITKQSKGNLNNENKEANNQSFQDLSVKNQAKAEKLQVIQNRSKSCIVSTLKGGQNKKVKIGHILSKFAKFKTEDIQNKRRLFLQRETQEKSRSIQMLKINIKINQNAQKQRQKHQPVLKLNQDHFDSQAKKGLINSIKLYCQKNMNRLPYVSSLASKTTNIHP